ncbi:MAG TPA: FG-GAP-like repeat-containing protein, partial [Gemmataceae bacterium]|nr:FG-GAP-like repeat-containing protein [Gemmataceae bacterium]
MFYSWTQKALDLLSQGRGSKRRKGNPIRLSRFVPAMEKLEDRTLLSGNFGLDGTFGTGGKVTYNFGGNDDEAFAVILQPDGKMVVAGSTQVAGPDYDFALMRLNPNGSLDAGFNGTGKLTIPFNLGGGNKDRAYGVVLQPDGKIVVVGSAQTSSTGFVFALARVNSDGSLDQGFNGSGKQTISMGVGIHNDQAFGVSLEPDNKIVVVGFSQITSTNYDFAVARLNTNGSLDSTFNNSGKLTFGFDIGGGLDDEAKGVAIQPDGKIVVAGFAQITTNNFDFAVARLTVSGTLDTSFNGTGKRTIPFDLGGLNNDGARAVAIQKDGKIVLAGYAEISAPNYDFAVARLRPDGSLDASFNGVGKQTVPFNLGGNMDDEATGLAVQPDGKIIVTGFAQVGFSSFNFAVARLTPNGSLDPSFNGGKYTVPFDLGGPSQDEAFGAAVQPDGKIVVAGFAQRTTSGFNFAVARIISSPVKYWGISGAPGRVRVYNMDGTLVTDFAPYGPTYGGGVSVAFGDVNGDGVMDLITGATTGNPHIKVFNGENFHNGSFNPAFPDASLIASYFAYGQQYNVGANVAAGDIEGSGYADIVTGATVGNPHVKVFKGKDIATGRFSPDGSSLLAQFFPYALQFNVGANV